MDGKKKKKKSELKHVNPVLLCCIYSIAIGLPLIDSQPMIMRGNFG